MKCEFLSILLLTVSLKLTGAQDALTAEELLSSYLGEDDSPPLSAEAGLTILGKGPVDAASTLSCHRRLYSYKVWNI